MFECGHFCINYTLKKDGIKKTIKYEKQFMSLDLVNQVLNHYYYKVNCYRVYHFENLSNLGRFITLVKIKNNRYHYVVVEKIKNGIVYYYDPLFVLIRKEKIDKFIKKWSHYCCLYQKK